PVYSRRMQRHARRSGPLSQPTATPPLQYATSTADTSSPASAARPVWAPSTGAMGSRFNLSFLPSRTFGIGTATDWSLLADSPTKRAVRPRRGCPRRLESRRRGLGGRPPISGRPSLAGRGSGCDFRPLPYREGHYRTWGGFRSHRGSLSPQGPTSGSV